MSAPIISDPFDESRVVEVPLARSPLKVALFQVRFPGPVTRLGAAISSGEIARSLSEYYPYADRQQVTEFLVQVGHAPSPQASQNSVLLLTDASQGWTVNVAQDSLSVTTTGYVNRDDLLQRASVIFDAISNVAAPPMISRVGLRYINRVEDVGVIKNFCDTNGLVDHVRHQQQFSLAHEGILSSISEMLYVWPNQLQKLQARWGVLPPGQSPANPLDPLDDRSWLLDIDAFDESRSEFSTELVVDRLKVLSERAYRFFRWFFTPEALPEFGAADD